MSKILLIACICWAILGIWIMTAGIIENIAKTGHFGVFTFDGTDKFLFGLIITIFALQTDFLDTLYGKNKQRR